MNKFYNQFKKHALELDKVYPDDFNAGIYLAMSVIYNAYPAAIDWEKMQAKVIKAIDKAYEEGVLNE